MKSPSASARHKRAGAFGGEKPIGTIEQPKSLPIAEISQEADNIKTFFFDIEVDAKPGQFMILWIPRMNEKPYSIAYNENGRLGMSIAVVGEFTKKLFTLKKGDFVGLRGPYGTFFKTEDNYKKVLMVGGGYGTAPLAILAKQAIDKRMTVDFCRGAYNKSRLIFTERLEKIGVNSLTATDDGSLGTKGSVVDIVEEQINKKDYDCVYICGPELMEKKIVDLCQAKNIPSQVSIERWMKCGFGICGQCCLDGSGARMCIEGPVVSGKYALAQEEFGNYHRLKSGKVEKFYDNHAK
ncbi:MAG: dihydroorotate dehydrogenase electron transfer subunit [bacterium]|nr:dihydroorotate dehydrogenase electron transfer subunit [bacterium]